MKKSIWILLALTMSIAIVPSRTLAQDAPSGGGESSGSAPAEGGAAEGDATGAGAPEAGAPEAVASAAEAEGDAAQADEAAAETAAGTGGEDGATLDAPTGTAPTVEEDLEAEAADAEGEQPAEEEAPAAPASVPLFRGSLFSWQQGVTVATMAPDLLQTYNPTYYWSFYFQPRINIDAQNFFVVMLAGAIELTNSDYTAHEHEPVFYDTTVEYRHLERWEGFVFLPSVRLTAPTSLTSLAADRYFLAGAGLTVVRVFPELADLTFALSGRYSHWFAGSNVNTTLGGEQSAPCVGGGAGGAGGFCPDQVGSLGTARDQFLTAFTVNAMPVPGLTLTLQYAFTWLYRHDLVSTPVSGPDDSQHWRNAQYFTLAVAYDVQPWLNLQLGYQTSNGFARIIDESGSAFSAHVNPFWDSSSSELYLVATVPLDALYEAIAPSEGEEQLTPEQLQRRRQGLARGGSIVPTF